MRRIRFIVEYRGTDYVGWQTQPNGPSVQEAIERALFRITGAHSTVQGSGRTDSGVHALAQVAHFDTEARMPADKFAIALNMHLPADIRILYSEEAEKDFHARFSAKRKTYRYTIQRGPHARVFCKDTSLHVHVPLDIPAMQSAAKQLVGVHDFAAFKSAGIQMENTVREIYSSRWYEDGILLHYEVCGAGFLYNMVRILVGTMLDIGKGLAPVTTIERALESKQRTDAGPTAPPQGLTLLRVCYPDFDTDEVIKRL